MLNRAEKEFSVEVKEAGKISFAFSPGSDPDLTKFQREN
jgi:hypothetical protein